MSKKIFLRQYNSPNIVIEPTEILSYAPMMNEHNAKKNYFDKYESPNIVIVPNAIICNPPSPKRIKLDNSPPNQSPEDTDISFLDDFNIDEIVACLNNCDNIQDTEYTYDINQTVQCEPIVQTRLNKDDLIKPHEDFINNDTSIVDNVKDSLKSLEKKNLTNIKKNGYERIEKSNETVFEIEKTSKKEPNLKKNHDHTQDIGCTEKSIAMVTCESVENKKERTKRKSVNDVDGRIIMNINVELVVNGCRDVKKCLKYKSTKENEAIIKEEQAETGKTKSKTSKDITGIKEKKKLEGEPKTTIHKTSTKIQKKIGEPKINKDTTSIDEKKKLEGEPKINKDTTSLEDNKKLESESKITVDVTSTKEIRKLEGEPKINKDTTSIDENKKLEGEPKINKDTIVIEENNKLEGESKSTVDITSIKENKKLEGESKTTVDVTSIKENKKLEGEPKTTIHITSTKVQKKLGEPKINKDTTSINEKKNLEGEPKINKDTTAIEENKKLVGKSKFTVDITSIKENKKLEGESKTTVDVTSIKENKNFEGEPKTTVDVTSIKEIKILEGKPKTTVDIISIKENKKLDGESKFTVDITSIKENKKLEGEYKTTVDVTSIKENKNLEGEPKTTVDVTSVKEIKILEGQPKTTVGITSIKENKKLDSESKTTVDVTSIKENKKLEVEPKINKDITAIEEKKKLESEFKTTVDITSIKENKKLEGEPKTTIDITPIEEKKKIEFVDKPDTKPLEAKTSVDEKIFKTEVNTSFLANAKTDVLEVIKLEQRMYNFLHKKFSILSTIHCGHYSKIFKCKDSIGEDYAVKMLNKNYPILRGTSKEIMLKNIQLDIPKDNLFCLYLYNSFAFNGHWCFLLEFYPKNLNQAIEESAKPFDIHMTQDLASQLVGAVLLLRNNNIVHSDIKPNHILLNSTNTKLKLCGFDNAYYLNINTLSNIGALNYRPPEVILGYPVEFSVDVWSTALVLYEMVTGNKLFPGYSNSDMLYRQMTVLGSIPDEMLSISLFRTKYFHGARFLKLSYYNKIQSISIKKFTGDNSIHDSVHSAYSKHWGTRAQNKDQKKLEMFLNLLKKMLVLYPKRRIGIEFVYANPFIYELFSS